MANWLKLFCPPVMVRAMRRRLLPLILLPTLIFLLWFLIDRSHVKQLVYPRTWEKMDESSRSPLKRHLTADKPVKGFNQKAYKVVHLDLKGAPPTIAYLRTLLPLLASQGCTALLMEYEDMFPYNGKLANLSAYNAYTINEVRTVLSWAHDLGMEVIPLVQTFGHLEMALKLQEFKHLRELPSFPQELCPSNLKSIELVSEIIRQVMEVHRDAKYIHIGADEVFHLAACPKCTARQEGSKEIFMQHVMSVAKYVIKTYPGVQPIIWDDMIRTWTPQFLSSSPLTNMVEIMVWAYTDDVQRLIPHYIWYWYGKTFKKVWVASAFKGATHPSSILPSMENHYKNTISWLKYIEKGGVDVTGFVLTGWSRYDHFAVLCELLPTSIPSLLLNLATIAEKGPLHNEAVIFNKWRSSINCSPSSTFTVYSVERDVRDLATCSFPGVDLFNAVLHFLSLKVRVESLITTMTDTKGWLTPYNVKHNFSSPWRLIEDGRSMKVQRVLFELKVFRNRTEDALTKYTDKFSASEWLEQKFDPLIEKLERVGKSVEQLISQETWPRRPLR